MDTRSRLRYTFTHHTYEHAGGSVFMFVSGGDLGWRWVARERAPPKAGAHFTPRTRSDTTLNFELKFARGHASHTPLAANSPYSLCLGVSRAWATRGASHHPYGSRYGAVHATAALIASGVARVRGGASAEPPRRTRATRHVNVCDGENPTIQWSAHAVCWHMCQCVLIYLRIPIIIHINK